MLPCLAWLFGFDGFLAGWFVDYFELLFTLFLIGRLI